MAETLGTQQFEVAVISYAEQYRRPEWQRKRLEVLKRFDFQCGRCGSVDKPLHVHHSYYESGRDVWDYPPESLHALCEDCHVQVEEWRKALKRQLGRLDPAWRGKSSLRGFSWW